MKKCPRCGAQVSNGSKFCPHCGLNFKKYQQEQAAKQARQSASTSGQTKASQAANVRSYIYCPHCGKKVLQNNKFCPYCGHPLHAYVNDNVDNGGRNVSQPGSPQPPTNSAPKVQANQTTPQGMTRQFSASALLFWVKGYISESDNGIDIKYPNTVFFGLVPAGSNSRHFTLKSITSPGVNTQYSVKNFIIGAVVALLGISTLAMGIGIIILLIGIGIFCNGILTEFSLQDNGGTFYFDVPFYNRNDIEMITNDINRRIEEVQNRRDQSRNLGNYFSRH